MDVVDEQDIKLVAILTFKVRMPKGQIQMVIQQTHDELSSIVKLSNTRLRCPSISEKHPLPSIKLTSFLEQKLMLFVISQSVAG